MSTPISLTANKLQPLVQEENANCTQIGVYLNISLASLHELELQSMARKPPRVCFGEMCELWLKEKKGEDKKWSVVFKALEQLSNNRLKMKLQLEKKYKEDDTVMLSEPEFIEVLKEMTAEWYMFGSAMNVSLPELDIIEDRDGMKRYMTDMLRVWLKTGLATWEKLQEAIRSVSNNRLADKLEDDKLKDQQKSTKSGASASSVDSKYKCQAFYQLGGANKWKTTLAFSPHHKSDDVKSCFKGEKEGTCLEFEFKLEQLKIIPQGQSGWAVTPPKPQTVSKESVDDYTGKGKPPHSEIVVTAASSQSTPPDLNMIVRLDGAKPPNDIQLERKAENPPSTTPSSSTAQRVYC